jgi:hypothetical protein
MLAFVCFLSACNKEGSVGEAGSLYGTTSKKWVLDKETDASKEKVDQQLEGDQTFTFFANGTYNMATEMETMTGKYRFDQPGKKLILTDENMGTDRAFGVTTLTDERLTLTAPDGSAIKLKSE